MVTFEQVHAALEARGCRPKRRGGGYRALCPVHESGAGHHTPSLDLDEGRDGRALVVCRSQGCAYADIMAALNLDLGHDRAPATMPDDRRRSDDDLPMPPSRHPIDATFYVYRDEDSRPLYRKVRRPGKQFMQERHDDGKWISGLGDVRRVLYNLPTVRDAVKTGAPIYLCEGEKDADRLINDGLCATTATDGAGPGKFRPEYVEGLEGASTVYVLADNDAVGRDYAVEAASKLAEAVDDVRVVTFDGLPEHGDVSDFLDAGHSLDDLQALCAAASRTWPRIRLVTLGELRRDPPPPVRWLLDDLWPLEGELGVIHATGGTGKSFFALELAISLATGKALLAPFRPAEPARVLYLSMEDGLRRIHRRVHAIIEHFHPDGEDLAEADGRLVIAPQPPIALFKRDHGAVALDPDAVSGLARVIERTAPALVIVDPRAQFAGSINENDNAESALFAGAVLGLLPPDCNALLLHHECKAGAGAAHQHAARGATAFVDACRFAVSLSAVDDQDTDGADLVRVALTKATDGGVFRPCYLRREQGGVLTWTTYDPATAQGAEVRSAVVDRVALNPGKYSARDLARDKDFREPLACTRRDIEEAVEALVKAGDLREEDAQQGGRGAPKQVLYPRRESLSLAVEQKPEFEENDEYRLY